MIGDERGHVRAGGFFSELRRRRVWRVAGAYVLVVWMGVEIVLETFPLFGFPDWAARAVVVLAFVGFPITLLLAWVFDITPAGVVRTSAVDEAPPADAAVPANRVVLTPGPTRTAGVFGAGILVALVGFGAYSAIRPAEAPNPGAIEALAVLPFADLSPGGDQAYFADGVSEELINRLARVGDLQVAGRSSSFAYRGENVRLEEVRRELGVDAVVEGSVRRSGDRLRVSVELVDAANGYQIWSQTYDRTLDDVFRIQDEIATAIVDALRLQLLPGTSRRRAGTESVRAHDAYLLGLARWNARTQEDLIQALDYFEQALAEDDSYAPAHAGLALTYAVLPEYSSLPPAVAAERGSEAAARALALDAQDAEAHAALGRIAHGLEWNLEAAEMAYRRAIEFQPSYATAHQWRAETLLAMGRLEEARAEADEALALDPLSVPARATRAYVLTVRRDFDAALDRYTRLLRDHPGYRFGHASVVWLCLAADCHDAADTAARAAFDPPVADVVREVIAADRTGAGLAQAVVRLGTLEGVLSPARRALLHAALDDRERAVQLVQQAYDEGVDPRLSTYLVHPLFDPVRRDPRFAAVTRGLGVEAPLAGLPAT